MTAGVPGSPREARPGYTAFSASMSNDKTTERGEKRGVLGTGRAKQLDKTKDADADTVANDEESNEG